MWQFTFIFYYFAHILMPLSSSKGGHNHPAIKKVDNVDTADSIKSNLLFQFSWRLWEVSNIYVI